MGPGRIFVLTGAGVSAESGLGTFRGPDGLWRSYRPEEVANIEAWRRDPRLVWDFYSMRRAKHQAASPNVAHLAIAELERRLGDRFFLCTQNVDGLHEAAGSQRIAHIHGKLLESKCDTCTRRPFPDDSTYTEAHELPKCDCGGGIRPNVVWFGEALPESELTRVFQELDRCDVFLSIGTSGAVEPVASFVRHIKLQREPAEGRKISTIYAGMERPGNSEWFDEFHIGRATEMVPKIVSEWA
jgi:NAD-dependent deacetylase